MVLFRRIYKCSLGLFSRRAFSPASVSSMTFKQTIPLRAPLGALGTSSTLAVPPPSCPILLATTQLFGIPKIRISSILASEYSTVSPICAERISPCSAVCRYYLSALKLTFRVACIPENNVQISNRRVRIDIFKQRSSALKTPSSISDIQQLPSVNAQTRLANMARPDLNKFNPEFFDLIMTKWVFLNPSKTDGTDKGTGAAIKYVSINVPSKYLGLVTQQITDPSTPDDPSGPGFGVSQMPISKRVWAMVSSDVGNTVPSPQFPDIQITCQRYASFRDSIGSSAL